MSANRYEKSPHNHRSLKGATMRVIHTRAVRRRQKQNARMLERGIGYGQPRKV